MGQEMRRALPTGFTLWGSAFLLCVNDLCAPITNTGVRMPVPMWTLLELNKVDFPPSCRVLMLFKHSVNHAWGLKRNTYSYIRSSQWGVHRSAQKNKFSVKGGSRQEVFVGEEERFWKAASGTSANRVPIPGRLQTRSLGTGSALRNPLVTGSPRTSK